MRRARERAEFYTHRQHKRFEAALNDPKYYDTFWDKLVDFIDRAARVFPTARLIAWDVAVLEDGFELIEGNYNGDPGFMQAPSNTGKRREILKYM